MKQFNYVHLSPEEVDDAIKKYVYEKGYKPNPSSVVTINKNSLGKTTGAKIQLKIESEENK